MRLMLLNRYKSQKQKVINGNIFIDNIAFRFIRNISYSCMNNILKIYKIEF